MALKFYWGDEIVKDSAEYKGASEGEDMSQSFI